MSKIVDARSLACPQPVILTRKAMAEPTDLVTIVDSDTSRDNVRRMAEKAGRTVRVEEKGDEYHLHIASPQGVVEVREVETAVQMPFESSSNGPLVLVVSDKIMGQGDEQLGEILVRGFFHTLGEVDTLPDTIIFFNAGVWLMIDDSPVLDDLKAMEAEGVSLLACGTCLNHFEIKERLAVGLVSNMYDIAEMMLDADKVVTL